jgi:PTS system nitrogen regulatory IIA component
METQVPEAGRLAAILQDEDVLLDSQVMTTSALLAAAAEHLGRATGTASSALLEALADREKLGSTAINHGIAVPHAAIDGLAAPAAVAFRLARPIEFEASDSVPVDLVFVVIWPSGKRSELLSALGGLCRTLRGGTVRQELRKASSRAEIRRILAGSGAHGTSEPPND